MMSSIYDVLHGARGGQAEVDGRGSAQCERLQTKMKALWCHPIFLSCKEVGVFLYQNFIFGRNEKWIFR